MVPPTRDEINAGLVSPVDRVKAIDIDEFTWSMDFKRLSDGLLVAGADVSYLSV